MAKYTSAIAHVSPRPAATRPVRGPAPRRGFALPFLSFVAAASFVLVTVIDPTSGVVASPTYQATVQDLRERHAQLVTLDESAAAASVAAVAIVRDTFSVVAPPPPPPPPPVEEPEPEPEPEPKSAPEPVDEAAAFTPPAFAAPSPGTAQAIAYDMVMARGWGEGEFSCLVSLWNKESGWRVDAMNPSSGAYGIPQSLPGSKMASVAPDWQTNAATQIEWGLRYITERYSAPCGAWATSEAQGWY